MNDDTMDSMPGRDKEIAEQFHDDMRVAYVNPRVIEGYKNRIRLLSEFAKEVYEAVGASDEATYGDVLVMLWDIVEEADFYNMEQVARIKAAQEEE